MVTEACWETIADAKNAMTSNEPCDMLFFDTVRENNIWFFKIFVKSENKDKNQIARSLTVSNTN